ncbi:MAG: thiamine phosphate synthase [Armatimonadota bacterium]
MAWLYLVTDRDLLQGRPLEQVVLDAVRGGVTMVQLREKHATTRFFVEEAQRIKELLAPYKVPLIINDRVDVALAVGADGVHIGQDDMPYPLARRLLGEHAIIGLSVETMEQVQEAEQYDVSYISVSPVFETPTKTDTKGAWGIEGVKRVREVTRHCVVAIGGLNTTNVQQVVRAGAEGIAVVSAICAVPDPFQATRELLTLIHSA